jgi:DNA-binding MarR family transcriptional regulator
MGGQRPADVDTAERAWATMRMFVEAYSHSGDLREQLGLGRGTKLVKVLMLLEGGPRSLSEIAEAHNVDAPHATLIADKLESLGFTQRTPDDKDRRRRLVALTPAGCEAAALARQTLALPPPALAQLSAAELRQLDALLSKLWQAKQNVQGP